MFSKFSEEAQKVLIDAKREMQQLKHPYVGSEHLFLALLKIKNEAANKLKEVGITYDKFRDKLIELVGVGKEENPWFLYTPLLKRVIETALLISKESSSGEVTSEHLLFAILEEDEGVAVRVLNKFSIDISDLQEYFSTKLNNKKKNGKKKLMVEEFGIDLTNKALLNQLDPVIGRDKELKRMMEILCRREKNNPLLIGDAGVGKTALVEELANLIVQDKVPDKLKNKRIISVSIASLVSGTKYRGEFEERVTKMLKELENSDNILLFIDEIHTLMGAGGAEGAIDAANIFKPALARGKIHLIGATTTDEYKQTIENDRAMDRRFQPVFIYEPDYDNTLEILKKLSPIYQQYHGVKINDNELKLIIDLSNKYLHSRKQPDKAIDILDEVCSKVALKNRKALTKLDLYKEELKQIRQDKNSYLIKQDYSNATKIKHKEKELITKINQLELKNSHKRNIQFIKDTDIALVISEKTNIPVYEINSSDFKYIKNLEKTLTKKIIGQDEAIFELVKATKRIKLGYKDDNRPYSYLFVGPTGVGKTKLVLEYANYIFGCDKLIRFDMSEYRDSSSISKIIGSAPGYIGYDDKKNKLEEIKNKPHAVILLDEIEKAHPSVLNLFLQILDDGKITDSRGNTVYFNNHIIIMTSNVGYHKDSVGFIEEKQTDTKIKEVLSLELLNRIQKVIYFKKLNKEDIYVIVKTKLDEVKKRFSKRNIKVHIKDNLIDEIISASRYLEFGARKIDQVIQEKVDDYIIDSILDGKTEIHVSNK